MHHDLFSNRLLLEIRGIQFKDARDPIQEPVYILTLIFFTSPEIGIDRNKIEIFIGIVLGEENVQEHRELVEDILSVLVAQLVAKDRGCPGKRPQHRFMQNAFPGWRPLPIGGLDYGFEFFKIGIETGKQLPNDPFNSNVDVIEAAKKFMLAGRASKFYAFVFFGQSNFLMTLFTRNHFS